MKVCSHCQANNKDSYSYCVNCGKPIGKDIVIVDKSMYDSLKKENERLANIAYYNHDAPFKLLHVQSKSYKSLYDNESKQKRIFQWITYCIATFTIIGGLALYFFMKNDIDYYKFSNNNNLLEAEKWYNIAAKYGVANASVDLSVWGDSIIPDEFEKYKKAANEGNIFSIYTVGKILEDYINHNDKSNHWKGKHWPWYKVAADKGYAAAQLKMAYNAKKDYEKVIWYEKAATLGNAEAQNNLGLLYHSGIGVKKDYEKAFYWFFKSGELGYVWGQYNLGSSYRNGWGTPKDTALAMVWYKKAANQNNPNAMNAIGELYRTQNYYSAAMVWFKEAAELKYAQANRNIAELYLYGKGVPVDYNEMIKWYEKAAIYGDGVAQYRLGDIYENGKYNQPKNWEFAVKWYKKVSTWGVNWATYNLGNIYEIGGYGIKRNLQEAKLWYQKSSDLGYRPAKEKLQYLK